MTELGDQKMPRVHITDLVLRDAHQSLLATRMRTEDMLPIADKLNQVGYWALEMGLPLKDFTDDPVKPGTLWGFNFVRNRVAGSEPCGIWAAWNYPTTDFPLMVFGE